MGPRADIFCAFARHDGSACEVVRVFDRYQTRRRDVISRIEMQRPGDFVPRQNAAAVITLHRSRYSSGKGGHGGHLEIVDVAALFDHNFLAGLRVQLDRGLISHRAGGHKQRRFFFKNFGGPVLQTIDSWVLTVNVVANLGVGHRPAHCRRWFGYSITAQIDHRLNVSWKGWKNAATLSYQGVRVPTSVGLM